MKIAHISDLHICAHHRPENLIYTRQIIERAISQNVDHIVITGDVTHNATTVDFQLLRKTFKEYGILNTQKMSMVIGNHDIFGGVHLAEDIITFPERCKAVDYNLKVREFKYYFLEAFERVYFPIDGSLFPFVKIIDNVIFIGINSNAKYSKVKNLFASKGKVSKSELEALSNFLDTTDFNGKSKIVLMHHHFDKHIAENKGRVGLMQNIEGQASQLRKKNKLFKFFSKLNPDIILHGHLHESKEYRKKGFRFLNAGGTIDNGNLHQLIMNMITIDHTHEIDVDIQTFPRTTHRIPKFSPHLELI